VVHLNAYLGLYAPVLLGRAEVVYAGLGSARSGGDRFVYPLEDRKDDDGSDIGDRPLSLADRGHAEIGDPITGEAWS